MPELQGADKTILVFPKMLHALSIDLGREKAFEDNPAWAGPRV